MENLIRLEGHFDNKMAQYFKKCLRSCRPEIPIYLRIDSLGGNLHPMNLMSRLVYYATYNKGCSFIAQIVYAESAALMFAVNIPKRQITSKSLAVIHLPVLAKGVSLLEQGLDKKRDFAIQYLASKTKLQAPQILKLDMVPLTNKELMTYGIATELVEDFETASA